MVGYKRTRRRRADEDGTSETATSQIPPLADLQRDVGNSAVAALLQRERDQQSGPDHRGAGTTDGGQQHGETLDVSDLGDDRSAIDHVVAEAAQGDAESAFRRGNDLFRRHHYLEAADAFAESAALYPAASHELLFNACRAYQRAQRAGSHLQPSRTTFARMRTVFADGTRAFDAGNFERAARAFQIVHRAVPSSRGELAFNIGTCRARLGNWTDAIRHFREAARLGVAGAERELQAARRQLASQRNGHGDDELGHIDDVSNEEALDQILSNVQLGEAETAVNDGTREYLAEHYENAADSFRQAISYAGENPEMHWNIAQSEFRARNYAAAVAAYRLAFGH